MKTIHTWLGTEEISHKPDILNCLANLSSDEVFTPPRLANDMLDLLPSWVWCNSTLRWLDPCTKSGVFLREVARRLMKGLADEIPDEAIRRDHIYRNMLHGISISEITALVSRRTLYGCKDATLKTHSVIQFIGADGNIRFPTAKHQWVKEKCIKCGASAKASAVGAGREAHVHPFLHMDLDDIFRGMDLMRFDVIMGNPPYQQRDGGGQGKSAIPLYNKFIQVAKSLSPRFLTFVIPARWYAGGRGLSEFRSDMLGDQHVSHLVDFPDVSKVFDGVDIAGGGCYFLWDSQYKGDCWIVPNGDMTSKVLRRLDEHDVFIRDNYSVNVLNKVINVSKLEGKKFLDGTVWGSMPYGLRPHTVPSDAKTSPGGDYSILLMTKEGDRYIRRDQVLKNENTLEKWKVVISKTAAEHAGHADSSGMKRVISRLRILPPGSACTETYLVIDAFDDEQLAICLLAYLKTRFVRFLLELRTPTQNISSNCFAFIPEMPMDREWIDDDLYVFFDLSEDDIVHIESKIKLID